MSEISETVAIIRNNMKLLAPRQGPERLKSPEPAKDINDFYELVGQALKQYQLQEGKAEDKLIIYTEDWPPDEYKRETISFQLRSRMPAVMGKSAPQGAPREYKPNIRDSFPDPDVPGHEIHELGWMMDNYIRFVIWSQSNKEANTLALWFEDFMNCFLWFFRKQGVNQLFFYEREDDFQIFDKRLVGRPLVYFVRTEKVTQVRERVLEELVVNLTVKTGIDLVEDEEASGYVTVR